MEFIKYNLKEIIIVMAIISILLLVCYILISKKRRLKSRFYINFIMYKLGLKRRMSKVCLGIVRVKECYETLVEILPHPKIIINNDTVEQPVLLRQEVALKLYKIADKLPDNTYLKIYSAFRSRVKLYEEWKKEIEKTESENPGIGRGEILSIVKHKVSAPDSSMGGHDTGAAVDIALCDSKGNDFDFGIKHHKNIKSVPNINLTAKQKANQKYLSKLMKSQNFIQYPMQWWHYSYGDRYWAAYKGKRHAAIYDSAEKEFENTGYVRIIKTRTISNNK